MEIFITIGLVFLAITLGLTFLVYWIPKKLGFPKIGRILAIIVGLSAITTTAYIIFEDQLFFKRDAKNLLADTVFVSSNGNGSVLINAKEKAESKRNGNGNITQVGKAVLTEAK